MQLLITQRRILTHQSVVLVKIWHTTLIKKFKKTSKKHFLDLNILVILILMMMTVIILVTKQVKKQNNLPKMLKNLQMIQSKMVQLLILQLRVRVKLLSLQHQRIMLLCEILQQAKQMKQLIRYLIEYAKSTYNFIIFQLIYLYFLFDGQYIIIFYNPLTRILEYMINLPSNFNPKTNLGIYYTINSHFSFFKNYQTYLHNKLAKNYLQQTQLNNIQISYFIQAMNNIGRKINSLLCKYIRQFSSQVQKKDGFAVTRREYLQFSKNRLADFGELPFGEIPDALKVSRTTHLTKLVNGVRVGGETWRSPLASITVTVKAGARQEDLNNSSVATFITRLVLRGTSNRSKSQIQQNLDLFGGKFTAQVGRETTSYTLTFLKDNVNEAFDFLSDILINSTFNQDQIEAVKVGIEKDSKSISDPLRVTVENAHFTSFRDHYLGQPANGIRENIFSITAEQVRNYFSQFYVGQNIVVSGAGDIDLNRLIELSNNTFGKLPRTSSGQVKNTEQPYFTPSLMFLRDDQISNVSTAVSFLAPGWRDPDYFAMQYFQRILGSYRVDKYTGAHLNTSHLQYNKMHRYLGDYPDILVHEPFYYPYSDVGIFGNFLYGNEIFGNQLLFGSQFILTDFASNITQTELYRARNKYFNDLLERNQSAQVSQQNAQQIAYLDRIITRTEIATRISHMDPGHITRVATKWFWDKDASFVAWGPIHHMMSQAHYNRTYRRSTLGEYGGAFAPIC